MKLLMENWRAYVNEETQVLTEEELNELLQEIGAIKSMLGRMRGGQKFKGGYGWEAAVEQWEEEDALKAAQQLGMSDVSSKEDFVDKVQSKIDQAKASDDPKAKKAVQDLAKNIEQAAEPEITDTEPEMTNAEPEPEADDEKDGGFMGAVDRGVLKVAHALYGTYEEPNAVGKMMKKAEKAAAKWVVPDSPLAYTNDKEIIDILFDVNDGLYDNEATRESLSGAEMRKLMTHLVKELEFEGQKLSEGLIFEASAWETLKYLAAKAGRMEKGGKIVSRGKADAENKAKIEKHLANPATKLVAQLKDKLEKEYPDFPNNKGTTNFGLALIEIWIAYDSIVNGVKLGKMEPVAANAIIRALHDLVDRYKNYELSDVGRHLTEADPVLGQNVPGHVGGIPITDPGLQALSNQSMARDAQAALNKLMAAEENAHLLGDTLVDAGVDDTVAAAVTAVVEAPLPREEIVKMAYEAAHTGPEAWNEFIKWKIENAPQMHFDLENAERLARAWETGSETSSFIEMTITSNKEMTQSQWEMGKKLFDMGRGNDPGPPPEWASELIASPETVKAAAEATGKQASEVAVSTAEALPSRAQAAAEAVAEQGEPSELAQKAIEQIDPDKAESVAQSIEKTIGSSATDLTGFQIASFWLTQFAIPAYIYSKTAIKLLRAKGKHSSRERELEKLLSGIDVVPERTGEAEEETNVSQLASQITAIVGDDLGSQLYKKLGSELKRLGYEDVLNEKIGKTQVIDLSDIKIPADQFDEVAKLLLKGLKATGLEINLGGKVLNAAEYGPKPEKGVDLSAISDYIKDVELAMAVKKTIYQVLTNRNIPVQKVDMSENKIFARWREMVLA